MDTGNDTVESYFHLESDGLVRAFQLNPDRDIIALCNRDRGRA